MVSCVLTRREPQGSGSRVGEFIGNYRRKIVDAFSLSKQIAMNSTLDFWLREQQRNVMSAVLFLVLLGTQHVGRVSPHFVL